MANFPGLILTDAGRNLQAKAQIGQQLSFTRVALGKGSAPANPESLTALVNEEKSLSIQSFENLGDGTSKIRAILTNEGVTEGFFVREIGVFAQDPDTLEEMLYSYANSDEQSDFLPAEGGATVVEQIFDLITVIGTATNVTAVIDDFITIATKADVEEIRPYILPEGGTVGQLLRKATNVEGDTEWFDASEGMDVRVASIAENRTAIEGQRTFNLAETVTSGLAVYVEGVRLRNDQFEALNATQVRLNDPLSAGTVVEFINNEEVGAVSVASVSLTGPEQVFPGSSNTYTITNFDGFSTYTVTTDVGTVSRTNETITLDISSGETADNLNLSIVRNGATLIFQVAIGDQTVAQPEILNPADGATDIGDGVTVTTSAFLTYPNGADTHASTDWQIATDTGFTNVIFESLNDTSNLESIDIPSGTFSTSTTYYVRARHTGSTIGDSLYSSAVSFTTADTFFDPADPSNVGGEFAGGYLVGVIDTVAGNIDSQDDYQTGLRYALVVAPKALETGPGLQWDTQDRAGEPGCFTRWNGLESTNTILAKNDTSYEAFEHIRSIRSSNPAPAVDGGSEWYLPAMDELELIYRNLKPVAADNYISTQTENFPGSQDVGFNPSSDPQGSAYTANDPAQTTLTDFQNGGAEAVDLDRYWTSTDTDDASGQAWYQLFTRSGTEGYQGGDVKDDTFYSVRPVRRVVL